MLRRTLLVLSLLTLVPLPRAQAAQAGEDAKIDALITAVEKLEGAKFFRNGEWHDAKAAADHLRRKRRFAGWRVKTARDFIVGLGTGSSQTGETYRIRFADGHEEPSATFLTRELEKLEKGAPR